MLMHKNQWAKSSQNLIGDRKECSQCLRTLSLDRFSRSLHLRTKLRSYCKDCSKKYRGNPTHQTRSWWRVKRENRLRFGKEITKEEFEHWYADQVLRCFYCGITQEEIKNDPLRKGHYHQGKGMQIDRLTIDRKDNNLGYIPENMVFCCFLCNRMKGDIFSDKEATILGETIALIRNKRPR